MTKRMCHILRRTLIALFAAGFIFFVGFYAGSTKLRNRNGEEQELVLKQLMDTKDGTPEHTEAILKLTRLGSQAYSKEKSLNFWLTLLPSVLIMIDILIRLFKRKPSV